MQIKICGLTTAGDALAAAELGADLLGFNFFPASARYITPEACADILQVLRDRGLAVRAVGVFVNAPVAEVVDVMQRCGLDLAQLHGDEPAETLAALGGRAFRALRPASLAEAQAVLAGDRERVDPPALLVDACHPGQYGGTGRVADWDLAAALARRAPVLLAGGLKPENVAAAVAQVQPWGVDVASGVEAAPGVKDRAKMAAFIAAARGK